MATEKHKKAAMSHPSVYNVSLWIPSFTYLCSAETVFSFENYKNGNLKIKYKSKIAPEAEEAVSSEGILTKQISVNTKHDKRHNQYDCSV